MNPVAFPTIDVSGSAQVKEWVVIHKIKAMYDEGRGLPIRAICRELGVSRNTVRKYLELSPVEIMVQHQDRSRSKRLDEHRDFLIHQLKRYPNLSAVKLARRLQERVGALDVSARSLRRYVQALKEQVATGQLRYYEPVPQSVPGVQCQVDPGELRGVLIAGEPRTVHFVVFVLSCSRLTYVGVSFKALDTQGFIELHDQAFRYFGGVPEECVYDQTKLVVISEQYRELTINSRFLEYTTTVGLRIHACEGYDPESKGKVEAGVKYVKQDCLYGEAFDSEQLLREHVQQWLETVANVRRHGTTGRVPREHFELDERACLRAYLSPSLVTAPVVTEQTRRADKTGLISWKGNKYTVPMAWQQARVGVLERDSELNITDLESKAIIASHALSTEKGRIIRNNHHYRDHAQRISDLEQAVADVVPAHTAQALCAVIKQTSPRIYKDQLVAIRDILRASLPLNTDLLADLSCRQALTAQTLKRYLQASEQAQRRGRVTVEEPHMQSGARLDLQAYAWVGHSGRRQEVAHEPA